MRATHLLPSVLLLAPAVAQTPLYDLLGHRFFERLGTAVLVVSDLNGDGIEDFLAGTPWSEGDAKPPVVRGFSGADGAALFTWKGPVGSLFGKTLGNLGDLDGDGLDDVGVGIGGTATLPREIQVRSLATGQLLGVLPGNVSDGAGDVDGDGSLDVLVGDYSVAGGDGTATVFAWPSQAVLHHFTGGTGAFLGWAVRGGGRDLSGDGVPDFLVGAPWEEVAGVARGRARAYSGTDGSVIYVKKGGTLGARFGDVVEFVGDLDGDGREEFAVGAWGAGPNSGVYGLARVFDGATGVELYRYEGEEVSDSLGNAITGGRDVDGDGVPDFAIAAYRAGGVIDGYGRVDVISGANGEVLHELVGAEWGDFFGIAVQLFDANGDGRAELLAASLGDDTWNTEAGRLTVYDLRIGLPYCTAGASSVSSTGAALRGAGSTRLSSNDLVLTAAPLPPGEAGALFAGFGADEVPYGDGFLCVGGALLRFSPQAVVGGQIETAIDFLAPPLAGVAEPGSTLYFQLVYRDLAAGGAGFNLTDGLAVTVIP